MPGAPNRPPEKDVEAPVAPPVPVTDRQKALRRLAPSRVALLVEAWKGSPPPDLLVPYEKAEAAFDAGDLANALPALELLSIRFAEPRWPTLPEPFRLLRVPIPAPMPPHWDPEHGLAAPEKEARRARRAADDQVTLAAGCLAWGRSHGWPSPEADRLLEEARTILATEGLSTGFYERLDGIWTTVRSVAPKPKGAARPAAAAVAAAAPEAEEA